jgi:hypothetical protein
MSTYDQLMHVFFGTTEAMQRSIAVLCEGNHKNQADTVTQTILTMLSSPVIIQMTAVGWQPFKGRDLTFPFSHMTAEQRLMLRGFLDEGTGKWNVYEHAMTYRQCTNPTQLKPLPVLNALCSSVLNSSAYSDRRLRLTVCNILLQRIQANIHIDRNVQHELNTRLFPQHASPKEGDQESPKNQGCT